MNLYHYTSIENLALILKNKTIRFSRLDCVDDVEESTVYNNTVPMGKYTFVSCWTDNDEESIPLWNLYTPGMRGVRIKMKSSDIFFKYKHKPGTYYTSAGSVTINTELETYFSFEEQFNDKYTILCQGVEDVNFIRKVEYSKDYKKQSQSAINYTLKSGKPFLDILTCEVGKYKNERWAFQEEIRFALTIVPTIKNPITNQFEIIQSIQLGIEVPIKFYDLKMDDTAFSNMEITIGPHCTNSDKIIIESLIKNLNPTATIKQSKLHGSLRLR
jgi:hypothetical protein